MAAQARIEPGDRPFFELIAETAFSNPFSERRAELDRQILGQPGDPLAEDHPSRLTQSVTARVQKLEDRGLANVRCFSGRDRELMQTVFLFEVYHQFCSHFDQLIVEQLKLGSAPAPVPFADQALEQLRRRGFGTSEACRYFSIFYQLRRAFHFILRGLVGRSGCMRELRRRLWNNVFTQDIRLYDRHLWNRMEDFSTLLLGDTGTGKGTAAAAVGRSGYIPFQEKQGGFAESFVRSFVALNLSQFPEALIESELFGHRKGAFTGAIEAHQGLLARCSPHGAVFLDEIGEVSVPVQIKLLQVLQERVFCPVGSHEPERFRGRVIAATNRSLEAVRGGLLRDDFYYRLCTDIIEVPSLRQRLQEDPGELRQLLEHVLTRMIPEPVSDLVDMVQSSIMHRLREYSWPGNVRELEQAVRRILLTGKYTGSVQSASADLKTKLFAGIEAAALDANTLLSGYCALLYEQSQNFEAVARLTHLDRRTVKKYLQNPVCSPPIRRGGQPA